MTPQGPRSSPTSEFNLVRASLEKLAELVLNQMRALRTSVSRRDIEELAAIVARDEAIDALELEIDGRCRSFMELRAPIGPDFRFVMGAIDIARNLERIGDCIEYVARHVAESLKMEDDFREGARTIGDMIEKCLDILETAHSSWLRGDATLASRIPEQDDFVDALQERTYSLIIKEVRAGTVDVELGMMALLISNKLEAIADIACHIAETVVLMIKARQIRHEARQKA